MSIIPMDLAHFTVALQNDAQRMRDNIAWTTERWAVYNQNCTQANMTTAGISTADQSTILAFIADLARLRQFYSGTLPAVAADCNYDVNALLGIV